MFYQDDPKKCTAAKMVKFGLAKSIKKIGSKGLVLDPFSENWLSFGVILGVVLIVLGILQIMLFLKNLMVLKESYLHYLLETL